MINRHAPPFRHPEWMVGRACYISGSQIPAAYALR